MMIYITKDKELDVNFKKEENTEYKVIEPVKKVKLKDGEEIVIYKECSSDTKELKVFDGGNEDDIHNIDN